jgi:hypothetical protein
VSPYFGQLELYKSGRLNENVNNDTINVTGFSSDIDLKSEIWVVNSGIDSLTLFARKLKLMCYLVQRIWPVGSFAPPPN